MALAGDLGQAHAVAVLGAAGVEVVLRLLIWSRLIILIIVVTSAFLVAQVVGNLPLQLLLFGIALDRWILDQFYVATAISLRTLVPTLPIDTQITGVFRILTKLRLLNVQCFFILRILGLAHGFFLVARWRQFLRHLIQRFWEDNRLQKFTVCLALVLVSCLLFA